MTKKLGFSCTTLPRMETGAVDTAHLAELTDLFLAHGFTYFSTDYDAITYSDQGEHLLRDALTSRYPRDAYLLAVQLPISAFTKPEEQYAFFQTQLERCGVSYFDDYLLFNLNAEGYARAEQLGSFAFLAELKQKGLVKQIGLSYHDNAALLDRILADHPEVDLVQLQINYLDWDHPGIQSEKCYHVVKKYGKQVIAMDPIKSGALLAPPDLAKALMNTALPGKSMGTWAIHWTASYQIVKTVLTGVSNTEELLDNMSCMDPFELMSDEARFTLTPDPRLPPHSTVTAEDIYCCLDPIPCIWGCTKCVDACPQKFPIPQLLTLYNNKTHANGASTEPFYYQNYVRQAGSFPSCHECGACLSVCPKRINIPEQLKTVRAAFNSKT